MTPSDLALDARLHAVSHPVDAPADLIAHLEPDGFAWFGEDRAFVTNGIAAEVAPEHTAALLESIEHHSFDGTPGSAGVLAHGALPFTGTANLVIPARVIGIDANGAGWMTTIGAQPTSRVTSLSPVAPVAPAPTHYRIDAVADRRTWNEAVASVLDAIHDGPVDKVVLAREVRVEADTAFDVGTVLRRLRRTQAGCLVFADRGFLGATPELLVRRRGAQIVCRPMAGTVPRNGDSADAAARLLASSKDAAEHTLVVDAVTHVLEDRCADVTARGPQPAHFADVTHLVTDIRARAFDGSASALTLALALHPTPAVAGTPTDRALRMIADLEPTPRGNYAGPVGWVNAAGDGEFAVALRCAHIDGRRARLHAGAGIVAGSQPDAEWEETSAKLEPMLRALVRP